MPLTLGSRLGAGLNHPNIVILHSIEEVDGTRFLTMELVDGRSLDQSITPGGLPAARVIELGIAMADALCPRAPARRGGTGCGSGRRGEGRAQSLGVPHRPGLRACARRTRGGIG